VFTVPRMLRSAISAFTRVFDTLCGALLIRGPWFAVKVWVPDLRSGVKDAAPRPGHEIIYTAAVVTPPSTTMVWPVMKLEASEPR
jgi:hypothetical protein